MSEVTTIESQVLISVCVATYKRAGLLKSLLMSLEKQKLAQNISVEIIVVDNDAERSAEKVVSNFNDSAHFKFKYFVQPVQNISITRNMCVSNSSGIFICFIDDDETASENWVINLYDSLIKYNADGAFGYVQAVFDKNIPDYLRKREFYFTNVPPTGSLAGFYYTTNAIIKSELVKRENPPFDPSYGLTGGEDAHLFERLSKKGAKFISNREAVTHEFIPFDRANLKYLYNRSLRGGQAFARRSIESDSTIFNRVIILLKAVIMIILSLIKCLLTCYDKRRIVKNVQVIGASFGKINAVINKLKKLY